MRRSHSHRRDELHADNDGAVDAEQQNGAHQIPRQQDPRGGLKRRRNENRGADDYSGSANKQQGINEGPTFLPIQDRKSVVSGKSVSVRVDLGGRRLIKKQI